MTTPAIPQFVETEVEVVEVLTERTSKSRLPNGRIIFTFFEEGDSEPRTLAPGQKVIARLNIADFSRGMIVEP